MTMPQAAGKNNSKEIKTDFDKIPVSQVGWPVWLVCLGNWNSIEILLKVFWNFWLDYQAGLIGQPGWPVWSSGDLGSVAPGPLSQTASTGRLH